MTPQQRMYLAMVTTCRELGIPPCHLELIKTDRAEFHELGDGSLLSFTETEWGDVYVSLFLFSDAVPATGRRALKLLVQRLRRGPVIGIIHPKNQPSAILATKLGAEPLGVDPDGFIHYKFTLERCKHATRPATA